MIVNKALQKCKKAPIYFFFLFCICHIFNTSVKTLTHLLT